MTLKAVQPKQSPTSPILGQQTPFAGEKTDNSKKGSPPIALVGPFQGTQAQSSKIKQNPDKLLAEIVSGQHAFSDMMGEQGGGELEAGGGGGLCSWCTL